MHALWVGALLLFSRLLCPVVAGGERAYAEKMLYRFNYWIETEIHDMDPTYKYTIAPGCGKDGARCTFEELMVHSIWSKNQNPGTRDTTQPLELKFEEEVSESINSLSLNVNQIFGYMTSARFDAAAGLDGFTDSAKLMPNVGDYYAVLARMGDPIKKFSDTVDKVSKTDPDKLKSNYPKVWKRAKEVTAILTALRRVDSDKYRARNFRNSLPGYDGWPDDTTPEIVMKKLETELQRDIQAIDFQGTIKKNQKQVPDIEQRLKAVNAKFLASAQGLPHSKAIYASEQSIVGCECKKSFIQTNLKKIK
ncbi:hypothetical protein PISL3812_05915 [Talaromyces islandicus]|uniref:Uncharacterized protein n=1 Tax=Talaromyces islandicus TaxID=28573 RepID=A0A0U1M1G8_TALIS|nr:hypothetical protein PISL3812_05915 [Talaromyces islandicus]